MYNIIFQHTTRQYLGLWKYTDSTSTEINATFASAADKITYPVKPDKVKQGESALPPLNIEVLNREVGYNGHTSSEELEKNPNISPLFRGKQYGKRGDSHTRTPVKGQKIYYYDGFGEVQSITLASVLGTVRMVAASAPGTGLLAINDLYQSKIPMWTYSGKDDCDKYYSYPISSYRGCHTYNNRQVCMFFEKSRKGLDEVRLIIPMNKHLDFIKSIQEKMRKTKTDIYIADITPDYPYKTRVRNVHSPVLVENLTDWILESGE